MVKGGVPSITHVFLTCFSFRKSLRKLTHVAYVPSNLLPRGDIALARPKVLTCLHGIRSFSMVYLVVVNTFIFGIYRVFFSYSDGHRVAYEISKRSFSVLYSGWSFSAEIFFTLSGLVFSYHLLQRMQESKGKIDYSGMIVHRLIRLTPALGLSILLYLLWPVVISVGPVSVAESEDFLSTSCSNWWSTLSFTSNWFPVNTSCSPVSWFVSVDFQLFLISPFFLFILHHNSRLGERFLLMIILACLILKGVTLLLLEVDSSLKASHALDFEWVKELNNPFSEFEFPFNEWWITCDSDLLIPCLIPVLSLWMSCNFEVIHFLIVSLLHTSMQKMQKVASILTPSNIQSHGLLRNRDLNCLLSREQQKPQILVKGTECWLSLNLVFAISKACEIMSQKVLTCK